MTVRIRENAELVAAVRASLRDHPAIKRYAAERHLDEARVRELVEEPVISALEELGTAYSAEMTSVVEHMTRARAEVHQVYERALSGGVDPSDPAVVRNLLSELREDMGKLADPETWARRQPPGPTAPGPGAARPAAPERAGPDPAVAAPPATAPASPGPAVTEPGAAEAAGTTEATPPDPTEPRRRRLKDLPADERARVEQLRQAADSAAAAIRAAPRNPDGLPPGWDYAQHPYGPTARWQPGDAVNMPDGAGNYPAWDTIRKRVWRTKAADELAARRASGTPATPGRLVPLDPIKVLNDAELTQTARTGVMPERVGAEIEHRRIPQRMGRLLRDAGLGADDAMELTRLGDPSNLEPTVRDWHAAVDQRAREINPNRNPSLRLSLDDRVEFPLGSASNSELAAIVDRLRARGVDLGASEAGRALRAILRAEQERRGASARWTVP